MSVTPSTPVADRSGAAMSIRTDLTPAQQDGLACVECSCDFLRVRVPHVPVGRSQTGSQIFVCSSHVPGRQS
jgi:hypothetical protein